MYGVADFAARVLGSLAPSERRVLSGGGVVVGIRVSDQARVVPCRYSLRFFSIA